jgi:hypothetical protein
MDTQLDLKFKKLMNEYFPNKNEKLNPLYFTQISKRSLSKKKYIFKKNLSNNLLIPSSPITNKNKQNNASNDFIFIQTKNTYKKDNRKQKALKESKSLSLSMNNSIYKNNDSSFKKEKKLATPDILQDKSLFKLGKGQLSINSLLNQFKNRNKHDDNDYIKKNSNVINLHKINNLILTPLKHKKILRRMTKFAMLNNLYHKYSSTSSGNRKLENNDIDKYYIKKKDKKYLIKDKPKIYLTYYDPNKIFNFYNIYKRNLNLPDNQRINNIIINKDSKIYIDCLLSKVDSDINTGKIFPKSFGKTIYNLQKDNSYIRIQSLDNIFSKIMKNNKNLFV